MRYPWNTFPPGWIHVMRLVLVAVVLSVAACTTFGHSSSNPSAVVPEAGHPGSKLSGNGNGGSGM
jgi:hypothetical protein